MSLESLCEQRLAKLDEAYAEMLRSRTFGAAAEAYGTFYWEVLFIALLIVCLLVWEVVKAVFGRHERVKDLEP
jgi:uncharacterized membrane protein